MIQQIGLVGVDAAQMMRGDSHYALAHSLDMLARFAPFQRFVESRYGLAQDSYMQAVSVLKQLVAQSPAELRQFLHSYQQWFALQPFAHEPVFPEGVGYGVVV